VKAFSEYLICSKPSQISGMLRNDPGARESEVKFRKLEASEADREIVLLKAWCCRI
jgi:hypothetical protein